MSAPARDRPATSAAPTAATLDALYAALRRFEQPAADPLPALVGLVDALRPRPADDVPLARAHLDALLAALGQHPVWRDGLREALLALLASRHHVRFFAEAGILPNSGFFSELARRVQHRLLPEVPDPLAMRDAVQMLFHHPSDHEWLDALDAGRAHALWQALGLDGAPGEVAHGHVRDDLLEGMELLSHRIAAMGLETELLRVLPELRQRDSPFLAQGRTVQTLLDAWRRDPACDATALTAPLQAQLRACVDVVRQARRTAAAQGTSLHLTYLLSRLYQSLFRLQALMRLVAPATESGRDPAVDWTAFVLTAVRGECERNSIRLHAARMMSLLALRVTENAGRTGEHYITSDRAGWLQMWRAAGGAGLIIAAMALLKILASKVEMAPLIGALVISLNYALGFVIVHILHLVIATKQPAMTASTIAATVGESGPRSDLGRLADLVVDVLRTQLAAILGNVCVAFPTAMAIGWWLSSADGHTLVDPAKAQHLLHDLHPLASLAIPHAAVAGVCLFLAGLISGYFDNHATYSRIPERVARLPWLGRLIGPARAQRFGAWLGDNLGGLAGNFLFGMMLGMVGFFGMLVGLPLDIRHIAFASANLGYAIVTLQATIPWTAYLWGALGVALVGLTNLAVSFSLALWVAMRSRDVRFTRSGELIALLAQRFRREPRSFFLPPRGST